MVKVVVVCALAHEYTKFKSPWPVVYVGVGKINAALGTAAAINEYKPQLVVNYGTAGAVDNAFAPDLHGLVAIKKVLQRDMLTEPFAPRGTTPFDKAPAVHESDVAKGACCATGDSFVKVVDDWLRAHQVDIVDMELFAIAAACHRAGVPWRSYKYVTDMADGSAADDWQKNVALGAATFDETAAGL